jgi:hypothetical protein
MRDAIFAVVPARLARGVLPLCLVLIGGVGCELNQQSEPDLSGPSDQGFNVELLALPDTLNADGVSVSQVRLVVRNQNGQPVTGYAVLFTHDGDGILSPHGGSTYVGPIQTGEVMATNNEGVTQVVYTAGTSLSTVTVSVRPYGFDATNLFFRSVSIFQR